jgi:YNFM family putative membrane transporter
VSEATAAPRGRRVTVVLAVLVLLAGVALLVPDVLVVVVVVLGLVVLTVGFFAVHSLASGWVGARSAALGVQGSAVYLCCYYLGSSIGGSLGGVAYGGGGWAATSWYLAGLTLVVLVVAVSLRRLVPATR